MSKSKMMKDVARFTVSGYISSVCNFVSAVVVRRILDPFFMGIYAEILLVFEYAKYNHLGVLDSLDRQIPYYTGKKELNKKEEAVNTGITFSLLSSFIAALVILILSFFLKGRISPLLSSGLNVMAILVVAQSAATFYVTLVRAHHLFGPLSTYIVIMAVCDIFLKALLGIKFGVIGILWATIIMLAIGIVYLYKSTGLKFKILVRIPYKQLKVLLQIGFPLLLSSFSFMVLRNLDRVMIISFLTKEDLGLYSIAIMFHSFVFQLPNLVYTVLFPRFYEAFGATTDVRGLKNFLEKPTLAFAYIFPVLLALAALVLPVFINYMLPKYVRGIGAAVILIFGTFFISITNMHGYLLVALKRQNSLVVMGLLCIGASAIFNTIFVKIFNMGIEGIALGTTVAYFLYSFFLIGYAMKQYAHRAHEITKFFIGMYSPILWVLMIFYFCRSVFSYSFQNLGADIWCAALQGLFLLVLSAPLIYMADKRIGLYDMIRNDLFGRLKKS